MTYPLILSEILWDGQVPHDRGEKRGLESLLVTCSRLHSKGQRQGLKRGLTSKSKLYTNHCAIQPPRAMRWRQRGGWAGEDMSAKQNKAALLTNFLTTSSLTWVSCYVVPRVNRTLLCFWAEIYDWQEKWEDRFPMRKRSCGNSSLRIIRGFPGGAVVENLPANAGDRGSSPGLGRSHMPRSN